ncbi:MAG TPA: Crp/Fnr family transcriptional regulator [Gallionellaceae bacterium]|nr:Crp/Fnr family transcriptional regulator [Gallionellaceae bacterium]
MLTQDALQRLLAAYPVFSNLPAALRDELVGHAASAHLERGAIVFDEDQACQGFPLLLSGSVRVIKVAPSGRELLLYTVSPGESCILTTSCLLGETRYHARGLVAEDVEMAILPPPVFQSLTDGHPPFRNYIFGLFSDRMTDLMQLVSAVAFQKLDQRLAALLVSRASPMHTTHQALADELGSVREIISRLLRQFADQGWIKLGREQIEVLDVKALNRLVQS